MTPLERRYRLLLLAYPGEYRLEHEAELLATLLEATDPRYEWPPAREAVALLVGGLRTRGRLAAATPGRTWADGLRLGAIVYLALACADSIGVSLRYSLFLRGGLGLPDLVHLGAVVLAVGVLALAVAAYEVGLAALAGVAVVGAAISWRYLPLLGGPIHLIPAGLLLVAAAVGANAWHPRLRPFRRPWPAQRIGLTLAAIGLATVAYLALDAAMLRTTPAFVRAMVAIQPMQLGAAAVLLLVAVVGLDPRAALAATLFAAADAAGRVQTLALVSTPVFPSAEYELSTLVSLATTLAAALAVTVLGVRRRSPI